MKSSIRLLAILSAAAGSLDASTPLKLWYAQPANQWVEALPIGNGRLGAMVFGDIKKEHIQFNEDTIWTGKPHEYQNEGAVDHLPQIRQLLTEGKQREAQNLASREFMSEPLRQKKYQPFGDIHIDHQNFENATNYRRDLDLTNALASVSYQIGDVTYRRETFASHPDQVLVWRETASKPGSVNFKISLDSPHAVKIFAQDDTLIMSRNGEVFMKSEAIIPTLEPRSDVRENYAQQLSGYLTAPETGDYIFWVSADDQGELWLGEAGSDKADKKLCFTDRWVNKKEFDRNPAQKSAPLHLEKGKIYPIMLLHAELEGFDHADVAWTKPGSNKPEAIDAALLSVTADGKQPGVRQRIWAGVSNIANLLKCPDYPDGKIRAKNGDYSNAENEESLKRWRAENIAFEARIRVVAEGGKVTVANDSITVENANSAMLVLAGATSFVNYQDISGDPAARCQAALDAVKGKSYETLLNAHVADYQKLFRRVSIDLGSSDAVDLPTDERLKKNPQQADPALATLLFQYGRYLLISSSRPGDQPANLQGIWNDRMDPPWESKWTCNINLEMNYWPAEVTNLAECHEPLFDLIDDLVVSGAKTAKAQYGARGWVLHHNTDLWRGTAPIDLSFIGIWPTGGAWLCQHLWEHYRFSGDKEFLAKRGYPAMKEAAIFFEDYLVKDPKTGWLISTPSTSPEIGGLVAGPAMDHQLIRTLFSNTAEAAKLLGVDKKFADKLREMSRQIAPNRIGKHGQLQEWSLEDRDDPNEKHRHVSHLWALHPGSEITSATPELFEAAKKSLVFRGDDGVGWSLAWKINFWARLLDGDHAYQLAQKQLNHVTETEIRYDGGGGSYSNLLCACPPFQIDGNFGFTAGIAEMLLQSHAGEIVLLPALPKAWPNGSVSGLRARGGFTVDIAWQDGKLIGAKIHSDNGGTCKIRWGEKRAELKIKLGKFVCMNGNGVI
jgi:alpha-L-fucosidase 2